MVNIIVVICLAALLGWLISGYVIFVLSLKSREKNSLLKNNKEKNTDLGFFEQFKQDSILSKNKLKLNGYYLCSDKDNPWVICIHGYGNRATRMTEYAEVFKNLNFNILCIDLRGHGKSEGKYYTLGVYDSDDVILWTKWLKEKFDAKKIILFGESMGGATALMTASKNSELYSLVITDSAPADFYEMFRRVLKYRIGTFSKVFLPSLALFTKLFAKYSLSDAKAKLYVPRISVPVLYIHGDADALVPLRMMKELYENTRCEKDKLIVKGADHTRAKNVDSVLYKNTICSFLAKYGM